VETGYKTIKMERKNKNWLKISSSEDLICYEKKKKELSVRLEARPSEDRWVIYRGFFKDKLNYTEEYSVRSREEAEKMLDELKKEKDITSDQLIQLVKKKNQKIFIKLKRAYREDAVEKWFFTVNNDNIENFFIIREDEGIEVDIIINSNYKHKEEEIIKEIMACMSLDNFLYDTRYKIYYYNNSSEGYIGNKKSINRFEISFESDED
jgi:hypothetical protein